MTSTPAADAPLAITSGYYTTREVGARWRIHRHTVAELIRRGELGALRVGNQWRISQRDIDLYENGPDDVDDEEDA